MLTDTQVSLPTSHSLSELLAFRAPYLEERLVREKKVRTAEEVARLLDEVKKYIVLSRQMRDRSVPMLSRRIDEVWHQFILFSEEYKQFCHRFFGRFVHHNPGRATDESGEPRPELTRDELERAYVSLFGPMSDLWRDELSVTADTRLTRKPFYRPVKLRREGSKVSLVAEHMPEPLVRVDAWAEPALSFLLAHEHFYVRELPPPLDDEDKVALCRPLVAHGFFRATF